MVHQLPQVTRLQRVLVLAGYLFLAAGPFVSVLLIPRGFSQFIGLNDKSVAAAIGAATATAYAPLDPVTCNGLAVSPGGSCLPGKANPGGFSYDGRLQAEQAAKQRAEHRALDDIYNARHPVQSQLIGLGLLYLGLLTGVPTIIWYRRAYDRAKEDRLRKGTM